MSSTASCACRKSWATKALRTRYWTTNWRSCENSRFLTVTKPNATYDVFLFNQPWIEIVMDPALLAQLKPKQLVQVFVNDQDRLRELRRGLAGKDRDRAEVRGDRKQSQSTSYCLMINAL